MLPALNKSAAVPASRIHAAVAAAVSRGDIAAADACAVCGSRENVVLHHPDYARPLFTVPVDRKCHALIHSGSLREPVTGRIYGFGTWTPDAVRAEVERFLGFIDGRTGGWASLVSEDRAAGGSRLLHRIGTYARLRALGILDRSGPRHRPTWHRTGVDASWLLLLPAPPQAA